MLESKIRRFIQKWRSLANIKKKKVAKNTGTEAKNMVWLPRLDEERDKHQKELLTTFTMAETV